MRDNRAEIGQYLTDGTLPAAVAGAGTEGAASTEGATSASTEGSAATTDTGSTGASAAAGTGSAAGTEGAAQAAAVVQGAETSGPMVPISRLRDVIGKRDSLKAELAKEREAKAALEQRIAALERGTATTPLPPTGTEGKDDEYLFEDEKELRTLKAKLEATEKDLGEVKTWRQTQEERAIESAIRTEASEFTRRYPDVSEEIYIAAIAQRVDPEEFAIQSTAIATDLNKRFPTVEKREIVNVIARGIDPEAYASKVHGDRDAYLTGLKTKHRSEFEAELAAKKPQATPPAVPDRVTPAASGVVAAPEGSAPKTLRDAREDARAWLRVQQQG